MTDPTTPRFTDPREHGTAAYSAWLESEQSAGRLLDGADGPTVPATYTDHDDANPICGHHKRDQCLGCGSCTSCDGCYCYED
jgi:hypothetical protein